MKISFLCIFSASLLPSQIPSHLQGFNHQNTTSSSIKLNWIMFCLIHHSLAHRGFISFEFELEEFVLVQKEKSTREFIPALPVFLSIASLIVLLSLMASLFCWFPSIFLFNLLFFYSTKFCHNLYSLLYRSI